MANDIAKLRAALFDKDAPVRISYDIHADGLTISVDIPSPEPPGYEILTQATIPVAEGSLPGEDIRVGIRVAALMLFFPQEMDRINEMLGENKLTFTKDGRDLTPSEFGSEVQKELHGKKN